jgi:hypothetical protein
VAPLKVTRNSSTGELEQDISACPAAYTPPQATNFFRRLAFTLSVSSVF